MQKLISILLAFCLLMAVNPGVRAQGDPLFMPGENGYACYRIPAIINVNGELIAFAEGRKNNCNDFGNNDIVMRTSNDQGKHWSELKVVVDYDSLQASNSAPVLDMQDPAFPQGRIFLFYNTGDRTEHEIRLGHGSREVWYITSIDQGKSWSKPVNITKEVHKPFLTPARPGYTSGYDWRGYANTPGHALQLQRGRYKGRIFVAANHTEGNPRGDWSDCFSHGFYTDDHGKTFHLSQNVPVPGSNEAIAAETADGGILLNARNQKGTPRLRVVALSQSGGEKWDTAYYDSELIDPVCQASLLNAEIRGKSVILFANPASTNNRMDLTLRISFDDGQTWPEKKLIIPGNAAYCDIAPVNSSSIGLLYERGSDNGIYYVKVRFKRCGKHLL